MKTRSANPSDNDLGSFIRARRLREGLTLTAAADAAEVVKGHMSQIENGKRAASPQVLERIGLAIGMAPLAARVWARPLHELAEEAGIRHDELVRRVTRALAPVLGRRR